MCLVSPSIAKDNGQWDNVDQTTKEWFKNLHPDAGGTPCCDGSDGLKVEDVEYYENPDHSYEVHVPEVTMKDGTVRPDRWIHVDKNHIVNPKDRPVNYAAVWPYMYDTPDDHMTNGAYCFMPGPAY